MTDRSAIEWTHVLCTLQARPQPLWSLTDGGGLRMGSWLGEEPAEGGGELLGPPQVVVTANPLVVATVQAGSLQPLRPLPGGLPEPRFQGAGGQVMAHTGRAGPAADPVGDDADAEGSDRREHVRAALGGRDRPGAAVGEPGSDPRPSGRAPLIGSPGDDLIGDESKVGVEAAAMVARQVFLGRAGRAAG